MSRNSKTLSIGLTALALVGGLVILLNNNPTRAEPTPATPAATVTPAAPAPAVVPAAASSPTAPAASSSSANLLAAPAASKFDVAEAMKDHVVGDEKAPVTIIEYASLTCPHCAHFNTQILPDVKKKLIETGKAKMVFRDFPLDGIALKAAMMTRCVSPLQYSNMVDVIFAKQELWIKAKDPLEEIQKLGSLAGLDAADFKSCTENKELETAILNEMKTAQDKYKLDSTPTFIFNDGAEKISGGQPEAKFEEIVNKLSKGK